MIDAAGLAWTVEQHPLEAVLGNPDSVEPSRVPVPRVVAKVRSDTRAVLAWWARATSRSRTEPRSRSATR
jgi:hypothetical protein